MRKVVVVSVGLSSLACGGLFVDSAGLEQVEAAIPVATPGMRRSLFYQGAAEAGLVNPLCADMLGAVANVSADMRRVMTANLLFEAPLCPRPCADGDTLAPLGDVERIDKAVSECGGDDPFGGELAPLRDRSDALDYLLMRLLQERAEAQSAGFIELRDELAVGLAMGGPLRVEPSGALQVDGTREVPELDAARLATKVGRCDAPALEHRVIIDPDGEVVAVDGADCGRKALEGMKVEGDGSWTVVDLGWQKAIH